MSVQIESEQEEAEEFPLLKKEGKRMHIVPTCILDSFFQIFKTFPKLITVHSQVEIKATSIISPFTAYITLTGQQQRSSHLPIHYCIPLHTYLHNNIIVSLLDVRYLVLYEPAGVGIEEDFAINQ